VPLSLGVLLSESIFYMSIDWLSYLHLRTLIIKFNSIHNYCLVLYLV